MPLPLQKRTARKVGWSQDASGRDLTVSSSTCAPGTEDETIRLVRLVPDSEDGIMDDVFRLEYGSCEYKI